MDLPSRIIASLALALSLLALAFVIPFPDLLPEPTTYRHEYLKQEQEDLADRAWKQSVVNAYSRQTDKYREDADMWRDKYFELLIETSGKKPKGMNQ